VVTRVPPPADGSRPRTSGAVALLLVVGLALGIWLLNGRDPGTSTDASVDPDSGLPFVALSELPQQAAETVELIEAGGPFPHEEDGSVFGNYEGLLPDRERGYYAEYTVRTPGSSGRGARRIVAGDSGELYWTEDHYASFERIER
jgi:ribonuclease T1